LERTTIRKVDGPLVEPYTFGRIDDGRPSISLGQSVASGVSRNAIRARWPFGTNRTPNSWARIGAWLNLRAARFH